MSMGLILYRSKYGATKKYVDMLRDELDCDVMESRDHSKIDFEKYRWIIFAGGIYASGISGLDVLRKNYKCLKLRRVAVFCVGASPFDEQAILEIKNRNLQGDLTYIPVFYGRGIWNESEMNLIDRTLCKMLQKSIAKKDPNLHEPWMKALISAVGQNCDWTDPKYLIPLMEYIKTENVEPINVE